jgi:RimJ/RimL family protein N-acetyltransferase
MEDSGTAMKIVFEIVRFLSAASLGLFAGGMLTEGCVLVPYWRSLPPAEFFAWYAANDRRLLGFFRPLTSVTALLAIAAALISLWEDHPGRWFALLAAVLMVVVVSTFFLYFEKANAGFSAASLGKDEVAAELTRWAAWHWWRTGLSFAALAAAMLSLWPQ